MFLNIRMNKLWYIHIMEYHTAMKMNELLLHTAILMNLTGNNVERKKWNTEMLTYDLRFKELKTGKFNLRC